MRVASDFAHYQNSRTNNIMSDARIGRVLVASLHQAIADVLPTRLDFYEHWLHSNGLRRGGIGLAPMSAVLGFLRAEGEPYERVMTRAGDCAAEWIVEEMPALKRRLVAALPAPIRLRAAISVGRTLVRRAYPPSRAIATVHRGTVRVDVRRSLFCDVRETGPAPLCGFYAAAFARVLDLFALRADAAVTTCRATGADGCTLSIAVRPQPNDEQAGAP